jgi:hypothetical protein
MALMMEAVCTSETLVYFHHTKWHYFPESCHLHNSLVSILSENQKLLRTKHQRGEENMKIQEFYGFQSNKDLNHILGDGAAQSCT